MAQSPITANFFPTTDPNQQKIMLEMYRRQLLAQQEADAPGAPASNDMAGNVVVKHSPLEYLSGALNKNMALNNSLSAQKLQTQLMAAQLMGTAPETVKWNQPPSSAPGAPQDTSMQISPGSPGMMGTYGGTMQPQAGGPGSNPVTPQAAMYAGMLERFSPGAGKAYLENLALTNEQKNFQPLGLNPVSGAGAIEREKAHYGSPISITSPTGQTSMVPPDMFSDMAHAGGGPGMSLPGASSPMGFGGPPPVSSPTSALPPPAGALPRPLPPLGNGSMTPPAALAGPTPSGMPLAGPPGPPPEGIAAGPALSPQPNPLISAPAAAASDAASAPLIPRAPGLAVQSPAQAEGAKTDLNNAMNYKNGLITQAKEGEQQVRIANLQDELLSKFKSGAWTTDRAELANKAQSLGASPDLVQSIAGGDPAAVQAFEGMSAQRALLQAKSLLGNQRIAQTEFVGLQNDLADPNKMAGAIRSINSLSRQQYKDSVDELGALGKWEGDGKDLTKFRENYTAQRSQDLLKPSAQPANSPPQGAVLVGTSGGKKVYKLPDGSAVMEQ